VSVKFVWGILEVKVWLNTWIAGRGSIGSYIALHFALEATGQYAVRTICRLIISHVNRHLAFSAYRSSNFNSVVVIINVLVDMPPVESEAEHVATVL
jgi:hypothetical protein